MQKSLSKRFLIVELGGGDSEWSLKTNGMDKIFHSQSLYTLYVLFTKSRDIIGNVIIAGNYKLIHTF